MSILHVTIPVHTMYILVHTCMYHFMNYVPVRTWYVPVYAYNVPVCTKYPDPVLLVRTPDDRDSPRQPGGALPLAGGWLGPRYLGRPQSDHLVVARGAVPSCTAAPLLSGPPRCPRGSTRPRTAPPVDGCSSVALRASFASLERYGRYGPSGPADWPDAGFHLDLE
jgi:hypothetical protein